MTVFSTKVDRRPSVCQLWNSPPALLRGERERERERVRERRRREAVTSSTPGRRADSAARHTWHSGFGEQERFFEPTLTNLHRRPSVCQLQNSPPAPLRGYIYIYTYILTSEMVRWREAVTSSTPRRRADSAARHTWQVSGFRFRVSGFGLRVSGFGFRFSGFGFRVQNFGFRVSGFGIRVSGFGFRNLAAGRPASGEGLR